MPQGRIDPSCREQIMLATTLARQTKCSRGRQISEVRNSAVRESDCPYRVNELWRNIRPIKWPIVVRSAVARRCFVTQINPRFSGAIMDARRNFLIGCAPGQPNCIRCHALTDLSLADQCLISWREALIDFRMLGNAASWRCATAEDHCTSSYRECQRDAQHSTQHALR